MNKSGLIAFPNNYKITLASKFEPTLLDLPNDPKKPLQIQSLTDRETKDLLNYKEPVILRMNKKLNYNKKNNFQNDASEDNLSSQINSPQFCFANKSQHMLSLTKDIPIKQMSKNLVEYEFYPAVEYSNNNNTNNVNKKFQSNQFLEANNNLANFRITKLNNEFIKQSPVYQTLRNFKKYTQSIFDKQKFRSNSTLPTEFSLETTTKNSQLRFDSQVYQLKENTDEKLFELNAKEILLYQNKFQKMADRYEQFSKKYNQLMGNIQSVIKGKNDQELLESSKQYLEFKDQKHNTSSIENSMLSPLITIPTSQERQKQRLKELHVSRYLRP